MSLWGIKICATDSTRFEKLETCIKQLSKEFLGNFETAEFAIEGFPDIKLSSNNYFKKEVVLPNLFVIKSVNYEPFQIYDKDSKDVIQELTHYNLSIKGTIEEQPYILIFNNLTNSILKIVV